MNKITDTKQSPLRALLLASCPPGEDGGRSIVLLAEHINISHQYLYRSIKDNHITPKIADLCVALGQGVKRDQFLPYIFKDVDAAR